MVRAMPFIVPSLSAVVALLISREPAVKQVTIETRMISNNVINRNQSNTGLPLKNDDELKFVIITNKLPQLIASHY